VLQFRQRFAATGDETLVRIWDEPEISFQLGDVFEQFGTHAIGVVFVHVHLLADYFQLSAPIVA
jgi:hypothetical protein